MRNVDANGAQHNKRRAVASALNDFFNVVHVKKSHVIYKDFAKLAATSKKIAELEPIRQFMNWRNVAFEIRGRLAAAVSTHGSSDEGQVADILPASRLTSLQVELSEFFDSLPRQYELWVRLPTYRSFTEGSLKLSDAIDLVETSRDKLPLPAFFKDVFVSDKDQEEAFLFGSISDDGLVYLKVKIQGYGATGETTALASGVSLLKQWIQLLVGMTAFDIEPFAEPKLKASAVLIDKLTSSCFKVDLPGPVAAQLQTVTVDPEVLWSDAYDVEEIDLENTKSVPPELIRQDYEESLTKHLSNRIYLFDAPVPHSDKGRILASLEWLFDAKTNQNHTLAFLITCIGLESLLGDDRNIDNLTDRLADRCAFLLGSTTTERTKLYSDFKKIYDTRSKLTHGRKQRLLPHEEELLEEGRQLLSRLIEKELSNLASTVSDGNALLQYRAIVPS